MSSYIPWIISGIVGLASFVLVWYYKTKADESSLVAAALKVNTDTTTKLSDVLAKISTGADALNKEDALNATKVTTAAAAATFLNESGVRGDPGTSGGTASALHTTSRARRPCFVSGFVRDPSDSLSAERGRPGSVDASGTAVA